MNISLFGPIRITVSGRTFDAGDFGGVKPKELLEMLLLARGHPVRKDTLIDALWPNTPPKNPTGTLESYVSVLRKRMFSDSALARATIVTTWGAYRFALDEAALDLDVFDRLLERADRSPATRLPLLQQAAELAVGELLEDVADTEWIEHDRELLCELDDLLLVCLDLDALDEELRNAAPLLGEFAQLA